MPTSSRRAQADDGLAAYTNGVANDALETAATMVAALTAEPGQLTALGFAGIASLIREMKQ